VAARGARILARLHVYEAVAKFQVAAEEAVRGHAEGTETPLRHIHVTCTQAGAALQGLAHTLMACPARQRSVRPAVIDALGLEGAPPPPPYYSLYLPSSPNIVVTNTHCTSKGSNCKGVLGVLVIDALDLEEAPLHASRDTHTPSVS